MIRSWKRIFAVVLTAAMALSLLPMAALAATPADGSRAGAVIIVTLDHADGSCRDIIGGVLCNTPNRRPVFLYNM